MLKEFFIGLSENEVLNRAAKKYGLKLGAQQVVAGTNITEMLQTVKRLNAQGISCTIDNLGEFVFEEAAALEAKTAILQVIEAIEQEQLDAHISLKPSQLGLDIDTDFCFENLHEIVERAARSNIFVNLDMENYERLEATFNIVEELSKTFDNVGTVIQAYLLRSQEDIERFKNYRLRIVKGAYKESPAVAYQDKLDIDINFLQLLEYHLLHGKFTSIATHDHYIIEQIEKFIEDNSIPQNKFEFQMLYGFRNDLQLELAKKYRFCSYVPFGNDWYGYFMRRLAERPQNIQLVTKQVFTKKTNTVLAVAGSAVLLRALLRKRK
ncbi:MAG: proline dehydrogenase family protein [Lysinibacillus sp.]